MTIPKAAVDDPKIFVMQRLIVTSTRAQWLEKVKELIARGWVIVSEWDDHPDLLPEPVHEKWRLNPWLPMSSAHACQTSTQALARLYREHNPEVAMFENALLDLPPLPQKAQERVRIVFAALNREGVNGWLAPVLNAVLRDYPQAEVVVVRNRAFFDALVAGPERKTYFEALQYNDYLALLASAHVALLPLAGIETESYKSDLKFIEAASRGAVCIASPLIYAETIRHGETGWIARDAGQWKDCLARAITDADARTRIAGAAWQQVGESRLLCHQMARRVAWYRSLWERREELTQGLMERFPELSRPDNRRV